MMPHFEIEFWYNDHEGTRVLHPLSVERQAKQREELEAQRVEQLRQEEEERIVRDQQRRGLRSLYRARFEEERRRYLQPRSRARRSVGIVREERVQEELENEEDEYQEQLEYDEKMPRGQRYEAVPQRPQSPIILSPIPHSGSQTYNYNSGVPTSLSSIGAPSIVSIPNSPPPSFHTHSSPGTPRPSQAQLRGGHGVPPSHSDELWGVAASTVGGETLGDEGMGSANDHMATITGLRQRVEWLEESMGRLLLEREKSPPYSSNEHERTNCCVSFSDASADIEQAFLKRGNNCCVSFSGNTAAAKRKEWRVAVAALLLFVIIICITIAVVATARAGRINRAVNGQLDKVAKFLE